ncbi:FAD:protein FMN transferase [Xenophilus arseniciresistens]|uniref:FAD:protein FMN transferase n=1 Tax=Xenophilus arseniciresistens TaxID=1283306 RepID=A0AAE3SYQ6_9BURK|nr:FAD:protein FMN transferase [Xenophilus arseniciresistens]MDA7415760.1 FAD:protein FMN transferase [Xenophilus arseniciresistens]
MAESARATMAVPPKNEVFLPQAAGPTPPLRPARDWPAHRFEGSAMGTRWCVQAYAPPTLPAHRLAQAVDRALQRTIDLFSHWHAHSELARFNEAGAGPWQFSPEAWSVIGHSLQLARSTRGAVDPTLGALVNLWGFGPPGPRQLPLAPLPDEAQIQAARQLSGWQRVHAHAADRSLHKPAGLRLDLSGVAKGWAVDQVSAALLREGSAVHLVEIGGELKARGLKPDLQPWWVELEPLAPDASTGPRSLLALVDMAVATSGDGQRFVMHQGRRLSHTLDGRTGHPAAHGITSVTVLHPQAMVADALATAFTVMGVAHALRWAVQHDLAARITVRDAQGLHHHLSPAMAAMLAGEAL